MGKSTSREGFSLTELLVALLLSSVVAVSIYSLLRRQVRGSQQEMRKSQTFRDAHRGRRTLIRDISQAGFDPRFYDSTPCGGERSESFPCPLTPITSAGNDQIVVVGDFNMNNAIDSNDAVEQSETVTYLYDASSQNVFRNGRPFLQNVTDFEISYKDQAGKLVEDPQSNLSSIRKVVVRWARAISSEKSRREEVTVILRNTR